MPTGLDCANLNQNAEAEQVELAHFTGVQSDRERFPPFSKDRSALRTCVAR